MSEKGKLNRNDDAIKKQFQLSDLIYGLPSVDGNKSEKNDIVNEIIEDTIKTFDDLIENVQSNQKVLDYELDYHNNKLHGKLIELYEKEGREQLLYLKSKSPDIVEQIRKEYQETKKKITLDDIMPLVDNFEFIDLVVEKKIPFRSIINQRYSESLSKTLLYLSNKKSLGRGGNPYVGKTVSKLADKFALEIGITLDELDKLGFSSLKDKADELNSRNIKTSRGKTWTKTAVSRIVKRWDKIKSEEKNNKISSSKKPKPK
ncbi:hypothetical protein [Winogradskyella sp. SYSU M77433]|uniref:hypothetical protein n=1 Tax=Winogradskyella sp. SYSU M77433 TaxID=3042722 RepID=UPI00248137EA|nr:hypothetical protein [Winogradskyella sp. SYSU M77433]MDH7913461.1 hypothetical protein [Winogradskyella sp. SYSU M77433]